MLRVHGRPFKLDTRVVAQTGRDPKLIRLVLASVKVPARNAAPKKPQRATLTTTTRPLSYRLNFKFLKQFHRYTYIYQYDWT